MIVADFKN